MLLCVLHCVVSYDLTSVYCEQLRRASHVDAASAVQPPSLRSLLLPGCEELTRPFRAALGLLCARRVVHIGRVVGDEYRSEDLVLDYAQLLPRFTALCTQAMAAAPSRVDARLPLLYLNEAPVEQRMRLFCEPFALDGAGDGCGSAELAAAALRSNALPAELRLPALSCRFLLQRFLQLGASPHLLAPLLDSLVCMSLTLHALRPAQSADGASLHPPHLVVQGQHDASRFPLMLAAGLAAAFQATASNLHTLAQQLQLPHERLAPVAPAQLFHGPLLLALLHIATARLPPPSATTALPPPDLAPSSPSSGPLSAPSLPPAPPPPSLPPSCVDGVAVRHCVVSQQVWLSRSGSAAALPHSSSTAYHLLQDVTRSFHHFDLMRRLAWATGAEETRQLIDSNLHSVEARAANHAAPAVQTQESDVEPPHPSAATSPRTQQPPPPSERQPHATRRPSRKAHMSSSSTAASSPALAASPSAARPAEPVPSPTLLTSSRGRRGAPAASRWVKRPSSAASKAENSQPSAAASSSPDAQGAEPAHSRAPSAQLVSLQAPAASG